MRDLLEAAQRGGAQPNVAHGALADAQPKHCPALRELVEGGDAPGNHRRMAGHRVCDSGGEFEALGAGRAKRERRPSVSEDRLGVGDPDAAEPEAVGVGSELADLRRGSVWEHSDMEVGRVDHVVPSPGLCFGDVFEL